MAVNRANKIVIAVPAYNEEDILVEGITGLHRDIIEMEWKGELPRCMIVIGDNNSSDRTGELGRMLEKNLGGVSYMWVNAPGKGGTIASVWGNSMFNDYDAFGMLDVDGATDNEALPRLVNGIEKGLDIMIGSRYDPASKVIRSRSRTALSEFYRGLAEFTYGCGVSDYQCGCKMVNRYVRNNIVPMLKNGKFAWDSELLFKARKAGCEIGETYVDWTAGKGSKVRVLRDAREFLGTMARLKVEEFRGTLMDGIRKKS